MTRLRVVQCELPGMVKIDGTSLILQRGDDGRFFVSTLDGDVRRWLRDTGLRDVSFARRCDLLAAVAAQIAVQPPPYGYRHAAAALRPDGPGRYVTPHGDYEVIAQDPDGQFARRHWKLVGPGAGIHLATLTLAAEHISYLRARRGAPA